MEIIETPVFTKRINELLSDSEYDGLQWDLVINPKAGKVIPGTKGIRKLRWSTGTKGKSGGIRVIYYVFRNEKIYMLLAYKKSEQEDLTKDQLKMLSDFVKKEPYER